MSNPYDDGKGCVFGLVILFFFVVFYCSGGCNSKSAAPVQQNPKPPIQQTPVKRIEWFDDGPFAKVAETIGLRIAAHRRISYGTNPLATEQDAKALTEFLSKANGQKVRWSFPITRITTTKIEVGTFQSAKEDGISCSLSKTEKQGTGSVFEVDKDVPRDQFILLHVGDPFMVTGDVVDATYSSNLLVGYTASIQLVNVRPYKE